MKLSTISSRALAVAALVLLAPALTSRAQDGDLAFRLADAGWEQVETNVFQRHLEDGTVETLGWGMEAVAWELDRVRERIAELENLKIELDKPSLELMDSLSQYRSRALELQAELEGERETPTPRRLQRGEVRSLAGAADCNLQVTLNVSAYPTLTGPAANATAAFSNSCGTYGRVAATASAEGIYNGVFHSDFDSDSASGYGSAWASASASVVATTDCWSEAIARVLVEDSQGNLVTLIKGATNGKCRILLPPLPGGCLSGVTLQGCTEIP